jgi:hypothetical protein
MWLATLNPGPSSRRGRRKKRTLSAWQRKVKKYGGVMQAVKASRAEKRGRKRRHGKRRFRRNSFLTTALTSGGAKVLMNAGRKRRRRKIRSRRSVVSGRSRSGRSRKAMRRSKMARKTRRRRHKTPSRGRGGRLKSSRRHRRAGRRRTRRNPVLPISWNPRPRRRRRTRRNPLFLSRRGFSARKHKGFRRLHRRRHSPRYWHNPRRRRSYRNNPVLPISWNPGSIASGPLGAVAGRMKSFVDVKFWTETGLPAAGGFFGSKALGAAVYNAIPVNILTAIPGGPAVLDYVRIGTDAVAGSLLSWAVGKFYDKKAGDAVWLGTIVNVSYALLQKLLGGTAIASAIGLSGLGDDLAARMKAEIARRVQSSINGGKLNGMGAYLRTTNVRNLSGVGEYVTERALRSSATYSPGNRLGDENLENPGY